MYPVDKHKRRFEHQLAGAKQMQLKRRKHPVFFIFKRQSGEGNAMNVQFSDISAKSGIPVDRIYEARASFPHCTLSFEVEFEGEDLTALSDLTLLFIHAGLTCECLRYRRNGPILALLKDSEHSNFQLMESTLAQSASLRLVRWTIVLSKPGR